MPPLPLVPPGWGCSSPTALSRQSPTQAQHHDSDDKTRFVSRHHPERPHRTEQPARVTNSSTTATALASRQHCMSMQMPQHSEVKQPGGNPAIPATKGRWHAAATMCSPLMHAAFAWAYLQGCCVRHFGNQVLLRTHHCLELIPAQTRTVTVYTAADRRCCTQQQLEGVGRPPNKHSCLFCIRSLSVYN